MSRTTGSDEKGITTTTRRGATGKEQDYEPSGLDEFAAQKDTAPVPVPEKDAVKRVLVVTEKDGTTKRVDLEPGTVLEYLGTSYARYIPAGGAPVSVRVGIDVESLNLEEV